MSTKNRVAAVAVLIGTLSVTSGCGGDQEQVPDAQQRASMIASVRLTPQEAGLHSRVKVYSSISELGDDSELVVVVRRSGEPRPTKVRFYPDAPQLDVPVAVVATVKGKPPADLTVTVEGKAGASGGWTTSLLPEGREFLMYLTHEAGSGRYFATGWLAGYFEKVADLGYVRIDPESDGLPEVLTVTDGGVVAG